MAKKQYWYTQEILFLTEHFGKPYFYMKDVDGHIYIAKAKPVENISYEAGAGTAELFASGYTPDLT